MSAVACAGLLVALLPGGAHLPVVAAAAAAAIVLTAPQRRFPLDAAALAVALVWLVSWWLSPRATAPVHMLVLLLVLTGFSRLPARSTAPALAAVLSLSLLVLGFATLVTLVAAGGVRTTTYPGLAGWGGYPEIGLLGTAVLPITVTFALRAPTQRLVIPASLVSIVAAASVLLSNSRGAWVASLVGVVLALVPSRRRRALVATTVALVVLVTLVGLVVPIPEHAEGVMARGGIAVETRLEGWQRAAALWRERPVLGWGPGAYRAAFQQRFPGHESDARVHAHSHYLQTAAETGTAGVLALAVLGLVTLRHLTRAGGAERLAAHAAPIGIACGMCAVALRFTLDFFDPAGAALRVLVLLAMLGGIGVAQSAASSGDDSHRA